MEFLTFGFIKIYNRENWLGGYMALDFWYNEAEKKNEIKNGSKILKILEKMCGPMSRFSTS